MAFALNFDEKLQQTLAEIAPEYRWEAGWLADKRSKVDVVGLKGESARVLVEVELKKDNPVENVVKIWRWATAEKNTKPILFVHAFSAHYHTELPPSGSRFKVKQPSKVKQYERAVFIGERMKKDRPLHIDYRELPIFTTTRTGQKIRFKPRMRRGSVTREGGGAMHRAAKCLAHDIAGLLHSKSKSKLR